jgi:hypothetical protein
MNLLERFDVSTEEQRAITKTVGRVKSVSEFVADAVEATKSLDFVEAMAKASPFISAVGDSLADAIPVVKFVVKLLGRLTGVSDPNKLGLLAFTMAYEQSLVQAVRVVGAPPNTIGEPKILATKIRLFDNALPATALDFGRLALSDALQHPFIVSADEILLEGAKGVGYNEKQRLQLQNEVHQRFVVHLKTLLSHGDTKEKFAPFRELLQLDTAERQSIAALMEHAQYQRALFEEMPVFGKEAFALGHVYVDTECGMVPWGKLRDDMGEHGRPLDAFDESVGGRQRLSSTVLDLIGNPEFGDAIVIQGVAGAGKSAFTQWLSADLVKQGLRPIRVLLRDVRLERNRPVAEAFAEAIRYRDERERSSDAYPRPDDPFLGTKIFNERVHFRSADICPYVLILDGWDEISISVAEGFKARLNRMLEGVRSEFLSNRATPVRVILTGRPSAEVAGSTFLHKTTPILTLRPFNPDDLDAFVARMTSAVNTKPLPKVEGTEWPRIKAKRFDSITAKYRSDFEHQHGSQASAGQFSKLEHLRILGLPLLSFLALRLVAQDKGDDEAVLENPTTLYRNLVDLTCGGAGKYSGSTDEAVDEQFRHAGKALRDLLRRTAVAMTVCGKENISYAELEFRLDLDETLERRVEDETTDNPLSQLMISYYFKGGHTELGCEFLHKSFREYLFAEAVVELVKTFGREGHVQPSQREPYWRDFPESDARFAFSREFPQMLSAQWIGHDIGRFIAELFRWEIQRAPSASEGWKMKATDGTVPLPLEGWDASRDALADLWDWWAEAVHLRPQPRLSLPQRIAVFDPPLAQELVRNTRPLDLRPRQVPEPLRMTTVDAHLGDALLRIASLVHFEIARATGWIDSLEKSLSPSGMWREVAPRSTRRSHVQTIVERDGKQWSLFAPAKPSPGFWENYMARINSAGWRPDGSAPGGLDLRGADLSSCSIGGSHMQSTTDWSYTNLSRANGGASNLQGDKLDHSLLANASFTLTRMSTASLVGVEASRCRFENASLTLVDLSNADLRDSTFYNTDLLGAAFVGANVQDAVFTDSNLSPEQIASAIGVATINNELALFEGAAYADEGDPPVS